MDAIARPAMPLVCARLFCDIDDAAPNLETGDVGWPSGQGDVNAYTFMRDGTPWVCINVAKMTEDGASLEAILSTLVHEATHCAQLHFEDLGERLASDEEMAYHVQAYARLLFDSFFEWLGCQR